MSQNHQAAMHHWKNARSAATASHVSLSQEQMGLTEFVRHNPPKFSGNATPDQADRFKLNVLLCFVFKLFDVYIKFL